MDNKTIELINKVKKIIENNIKKHIIILYNEKLRIIVKIITNVLENIFFILKHHSLFFVFLF